jgi:HEAT repeat protein
MLNYENFAVSFARAVEVFRTRTDEVPELKGALRTIVALSKLGGVEMRVSHRTLTVNTVQIPPTLPGVRSLIAQFDLHGVGEVRIAQNARPADLLALLRGLAATLSGYAREGGLEAQFQDADGESVMVLTVSPGAPKQGGRSQSVTAAFEAEKILGEAEGRDSAATTLADAMEGATAGSLLELAVAELALRHSGADLVDRVTSVADLVQVELSEAGTETALWAMSELIRLERGLSDVEVRRSISPILDRLFTRRTVGLVLPLLEASGHQEQVALALSRAGWDAALAVLECIRSAASVSHRRACVDALLQTPEGTEQFLGLFDHAEPGVVLNVTELAGQLRLEGAAPSLGKTLNHPEPRVRKAAGVALARIGTAVSVEYLRAALRNEDPEVRVLGASAVRGRESGALTTPLALAAEEEPDQQVQREYYRALGRISTPGALQALINAAQPGGRFFRRRRATLRMAAIEGLKVAGGEAAVGTLEGLSKDRNRQIRKAAREALEEVRRPGIGA